MGTAFLLRNKWALGDGVCMSALVRDIARAYPGRYKVYVSGHYLSHWKNNPYCEAVDDRAIAAMPNGKVRTVNLDYRDGIKEASKGRKMHFLSYFHTDFKKKTGIEVPVTEPKGDIHLSETEMVPPLSGRYWVVNAGGKGDMTTKIWLTSRHQTVVNTLAELGITCAQIGAKFARHYHPRLVKNHGGKPLLEMARPTVLNVLRLKSRTGICTLSGCSIAAAETLQEGVGKIAR
jgi:hypothetical protein